MTVAITGAAGFIGSNVAERLHTAGHRIVAIDDLSLGRAGNVHPDIPLIVGDAASSEVDRKSTRLNSSHIQKSRMPSSA